MNDEFAGGQEVQSNWVKYDKIGDGIKGTLLGKKFQEANLPGYQDQWVYQIKKANGTIWNAPVSASKSGTIERLDNCKLGEIIAIFYEKDGEAQKGKKPAKMLKVLTYGMDATYGMGEEVPADIAPSFD